MRICLICNEYPPDAHGGIGSYTHMLAHQLSARGHQVRVIGAYSRRKSFRREMDGPVEVHRIPVYSRTLGWLGSRYSIFRALAEWSEAGEVDLVEVPDWEGYAAAWPPLNIPVVVRLHGSLSYFAAEMGDTAPRTALWIERQSFHRADYWSSTSGYTARRTQELFGPHRGGGCVIYNFVDGYWFSSESYSRNYNQVVFAGTLTPKKGVIPLAECWPEVVAENSHAELLFYGKDEGTPGGKLMTEYLPSLIRERVRPSMRFAGRVSRQQLHSVFETCGVAVFPSYSEAFAIAPLEAMAAGCPVIFTRRSSGPEAIRDGIDGLLADPDDRHEVAACIRRLIADRELARKIGAAGMARARNNFSAEVIVPKIEAFYDECMGHFRAMHQRTARGA